MELARYPGRLACIDAPGFDAFSVALSGQQFKPSPATEAYLATELAAARRNGRQARARRHRRLRRGDQRYSGSTRTRHSRLDAQRRRRDDVPARRTFRRRRWRRGATLRAAERARRTARCGEGALRLQRPPRAERPGGADDAAEAVPLRAADVRRARRRKRDRRRRERRRRRPPHSARCRTRSSCRRTRSATGRPLMVAGPQLGYFFPEFFWEVDMEGGGVSVRGGSLAGIPNVLIGRGPDYGWSFTSSESDNIDTFVETLCGGRPALPLQGQCTAMTRFDAGATSPAASAIRSPSRRPCTARWSATATVAGKRVALAQERSTRGRELKAALDVYDLSTGRLRTPQQFTHDLSRFEMSFNCFYVDSKHVAYVSIGPAARARRRRRPGAADRRHRRVRLAWVPRSGRASTGDRPARPDRELEQQAGAGLRLGGRQLLVRRDPSLVAAATRAAGARRSPSSTPSAR